MWLCVNTAVAWFLHDGYCRWSNKTKVTNEFTNLVHVSDPGRGEPVIWAANVTPTMWSWICKVFSFSSPNWSLSWGRRGGTRVSKVAAINYMQEDTFLPQALFQFVNKTMGEGEGGGGEEEGTCMSTCILFYQLSWQVCASHPPTHRPIPRMCSYGRTSVSWREG